MVQVDMCPRDLENANYHTIGKWKQVKTVSIVSPNLRFLNGKIQNTVLFCGPIQRISVVYFRLHFGPKHIL